MHLVFLPPRLEKCLADEPSLLHTLQLGVQGETKLFLSTLK